MQAPSAELGFRYCYDPCNGLSAVLNFQLERSMKQNMPHCFKIKTLKPVFCNLKGADPSNEKNINWSTKHRGLLNH